LATATFEMLALGAAALIYLVTEELLVEALRKYVRTLHVSIVLCEVLLLIAVELGL
jgi:hypothetical protein